MQITGRARRAGALAIGAMLALVWATTATAAVGGLPDDVVFDDNVPVARGLLALPDGASVVYDPPLDAYFTVTGDVVAPVSDTGRTELPAPTSVTRFQHRVVARYADGGAGVSGLAPTDPARAMAGGGVPAGTHDQGAGRDTAPWVAAVGAAAAVIAAAALVRRRRARDQR